MRRLGPTSRDAAAMKLLVVRLVWWLRRHRDSIDVVQVIMYPDFVISAWLAGLSDRTVMCWAGLGDATDVLCADGAALPRARAGRVSPRDGTRDARRLDAGLQAELTAVGIDKVVVIPTPVDLDDFRPPDADERHAAGTARHRRDQFRDRLRRSSARTEARPSLIDAVAMRVARGATPAVLLGDSRADSTTAVRRFTPR